MSDVSIDIVEMGNITVTPTVASVDPETYVSS